MLLLISPLSPPQSLLTASPLGRWSRQREGSKSSWRQQCRCSPGCPPPLMLLLISPLSPPQATVVVDGEPLGRWNRHREGSKSPWCQQCRMSMQPRLSSSTLRASSISLPQVNFPSREVSLRTVITLGYHTRYGSSTNCASLENILQVHPS